MNKYVRTKKGEILDLENIKREVRDNEFYYKDFIFEEIKQDGNDIRLDYSAIGTVENCLEEQKGKRCKFALVNYGDEILKQADTIEELCDEFIYVNKIEGLDDKTHTISFEDMPNHQFTEPTVAEKLEYIHKRYKDDLDKIKLGIWTDKGLIYVAKMNDKGEFKLI